MPRFRRHSDAKSSEGRFLASRIIDAKRRGATNREIGSAFGINERTVRKIVSGDTPGTRTFERIVERPRRASERTLERGGNPSIVRVDLQVGVDGTGQPIVRSVNAQVPTVMTRSGKRVTPTPADIFRIPQLAALIDIERERMERQYGHLTTSDKGAGVLSFRPIMHRRRPLRFIVAGIIEG